MKKQKTLRRTRVLPALIGIALASWMTSCGGSGPTGTGISNTVVGTGGTEPIAYLGTALPFSANVFATDTIAGLTATLRPAAGGEPVLTAEIEPGNLKGSVRAKVEDQLDLPAEIRPGDYTFSLTLTDKAGKQESTDSPVRLMIDTSLPAVLDLEIGINAAGDDLHLAAHVTAPNKLAKITVSIKGAAWEDEQVVEGTSLAGKIEHHFHEHAHVDAAPAGDYQVTVTATDQQGRTSSVTGNFTKR